MAEFFGILLDKIWCSWQTRNGSQRALRRMGTNLFNVEVGFMTEKLAKRRGCMCVITFGFNGWMDWVLNSITSLGNLGFFRTRICREGGHVKGLRTQHHGYLITTSSCLQMFDKKPEWRERGKSYYCILYLLQWWHEFTIWGM